jgi:hypothetical protein
MSAEYDIGSKYLTVATETRKVVDLLLPFLEKGERNTSLLDSLTGFIESLESGESAETLLARLRAPGSRPIYEELLTDEELDTPEERAHLVAELRNVAVEKADLPGQQVSARAAVLLLCAIEGRALHRFNRLSEADESLSLVR